MKSAGGEDAGRIAGAPAFAEARLCGATGLGDHPAMTLPPATAAWFRSACVAELVRAGESLDRAGVDRDAAVHEARKSLLRVRAWLRLLDRDHRQAIGEIDQRLRRARRLLGPLRNAASRIEALDELAARRGFKGMRAVFTTLHQRLHAALGRCWSRRPVGGRVWRMVRAEIDALAQAVAGWSLATISAAELQRGFARAWRRVRRAKLECLDARDVGRRHFWRGRVRRLLLQGQLLATRGTVTGVRELKSLSEALGHEHDLALVASALRRMRPWGAVEPTLILAVETLRLAAAARSDRLARRVLRRGRRPRWIRDR
jgi:hypothetical protein